LQFLDELDAVVLKHGGRLYMSKDARMKPEVLRSGYSRLDEFRAIVKKYNPSGKISSIQSRRLLLTDN
jgi:decaprenylphospho-beta-D-ribofuranose 2-oxidase